MIKFIVFGLVALLAVAFLFPSLLQMGRAVGREVGGAIDDVTEEEDSGEGNDEEN